MISRRSDLVVTTRFNGSIIRSLIPCYRFCTSKSCASECAIDASDCPPEVMLAPFVTPVTLARRTRDPGATLLHPFLSLPVIQSQSVAVVSQK